MTDRDELLRRVSRINPAPAAEPLPIDVADSRPPLAWLIEGTPFMASTRPTPSRRTPLIAAAVTILAVTVAVPWLLMSSGEDDRVATTILPVVTTTSAAPTSTTHAITTVPPGIVPLVGTTFEDAGIAWVIAEPRLDLVSRDEAWALLGPTTIGHWIDGRWALFGFAPSSGDNALPIDCRFCDGAEPPLFYDIAATDDGSVWVTTDSGVFSFDGTEWMPHTEGLPVGASAIGVDDQGRVWIAGFGDGGLWLALEDEGSWIADPSNPYSSDPVVPVRLVTFLNGDIWVASLPYSARVARHAAEAESPTDLSIEPTPGNPVEFALGPDGVVWTAGYLDHGERAMVARRDGTAWTILELPEIFRTFPYLSDIAVDPQGVVWVYGLGAILSFDGTSWTLRATDAIAMDMLDDGTIEYLDDDGDLHFLFTIEP